MAFFAVSCDNGTKGPDLPDQLVNAPEVNTEEKYSSLSDSAKMAIVKFAESTSSSSSDYSELASLLSNNMLINPNTWQTVQNDEGTIYMRGYYDASIYDVNKTVVYDGHSTDGLTFWGSVDSMSSPASYGSTSSFVVVRVDQATNNLEVGDVFSYGVSGTTSYSLNGQEVSGNQ